MLLDWLFFFVLNKLSIYVCMVDDISVHTETCNEGGALQSCKE